VSFEQPPVRQIRRTRAQLSLYSLFTRYGTSQDCAREGIDLPAIKYSDNAECLRLIDGPNGIFSQLQEEGALPRGTQRATLVVPTLALAYTDAA